MRVKAEEYPLTDAAALKKLEAMLSSGLIDAVMICTPHFHHPGMAIKAIERSIHTMIEKPVGIFPEELNALEACLRTHPEVKAGVLYCRRTNPIFLQIKDFLDSGALGQLKRVTWIITNASVYRTQAYYNSGGWMSAPTHVFHPDEDMFDRIYTAPNNVNLPDYHRLDLGINFIKTTRRGNERTWNIGLYNAYCRKNVVFVAIDHKEDNSLYGTGRAIFPIIPSFSYSLKF